MFRFKSKFISMSRFIINQVLILFIILLFLQSLGLVIDLGQGLDLDDNFRLSFGLFFLGLGGGLGVGGEE